MNKNPSDSDLEEGEILDDSPPPPYENTKILPRHYIFHENKHELPRHKRNCKYSQHHKEKFLSKQKGSNVKICHKKHRKSCLLRTSKSKSFKHHSHYSSNFSDKNTYDSTLISEIKKSYKTVQNSNLVCSKINNSSKLEKSKLESSPSRSSHNFTETNSNSVNKTEDLNVDNSNIDEDANCMNKPDVTKTECITESRTTITDLKNEESEDEEELRRMALATCSQQNKESNINSCSDISSEFLCNSSSLNACNNMDSTNCDNYEVVDMEIDDVSAEGNNLFVIDTKPNTNVKNDTTVTEPSGSNEMNDGASDSDSDFEMELLRAQLIDSMVSKKPEINNDKQSSVSNVNKENIMQHDNHVCKENNLKKDKISKTPSDRILRVKECHPKNRFVIALNEESSEDSDIEDAKQKCAGSENAVASLEALISNARHMSSSVEKSEDSVNIPNAVSCLSKAQQEEYNNLIKILSKNSEKVPNYDENQPQLKKISEFQNLKFLELKLISVKENLRKQKELLLNSEKQVNRKKYLYMKSKLTTLNLKERLIAAEKVRRVNLKAWASCSDKLKAVKGSVNTLEKQLLYLKNTCSKLGSCLEGKQYIVPSPEI